MGAGCMAAGADDGAAAVSVGPVAQPASAMLTTAPAITPSQWPDFIIGKSLSCMEPFNKAFQVAKPGPVANDLNGGVSLPAWQPLIRMIVTSTH